MYVKLLKEALSETSGESEFQPQLDLDFDYYIPQSFVENPQERMNLYLAVSKAESYEDVEKSESILKSFTVNYHLSLTYTFP